MGYFLHRAIIVDGFNGEHVLTAQARAVGIFARHGFGGLVTGVYSHAVNGGNTFMIVPDGSKEGWGDSDKGDLARGQFIEFLRKKCGEGWYLTWVEVVIHDDDGPQRVENGSDATEADAI